MNTCPRGRLKMVWLSFSISLRETETFRDAQEWQGSHSYVLSVQSDLEIVEMLKASQLEKLTPRAYLNFHPSWTVL